MNALLRAVVLAAALCVVTARGASADEDWRAIVALDAGPGTQPRTAREATATALAHLDRQDRALRSFLAVHRGDSHEFEARMRLSRALQLRADLTGDEKLRAEGRRMLGELERIATPAQRVEVDFAKITAFMRTLGKPSPQQRAELLAMAHRFQSDHPTDRRIAALFTQVAALFPMQPQTMLALLENAQPLARDPELQARIADDLKRARLFGKPVALSGPTLSGSAADIESMRGKVVLVLFFAEFSPPSTEALSALKTATAELPRESVRVLGVSLDESRDALAALVRRFGITWPVIFYGKGWESPPIRALGINLLPTAWLLDTQGRLRSLDALEGTAGQIRQLLKE